MAAVSTNGGAIPTIPVQPEPTFMGNAINWFRDPDTSLLLKIGAVALYVIATLAAGYVLDAMALTFSAVTIGMIAWILKELSSEATPPVTSQATSQVTSQATPQVTQRVPSQLSGSERALNQVKDAIGGPNTFDRLPTLDMGGKSSLEAITPEDMSQSMMRGQIEGRQFIAIKMQQKEAWPDVIVMVLHQKDLNGSEWSSLLTCCGAKLDSEETLTAVQLDYVRSLCAGGEGDFELANARPLAESSDEPVNLPDTYRDDLRSDLDYLQTLRNVFPKGATEKLLNVWESPAHKKWMQDLLLPDRLLGPKTTAIRLALLSDAFPRIPAEALANLTDEERGLLRLLFQPKEAD